MSWVLSASAGVPRGAAIGLAAAGWPVLRGTYPDGRGGWRGCPGAVGLRPVDEDWHTAWTRDADQVARWWATEPFNVLVACGQGVDCLEVPVGVRPRVLRALRAANVGVPAMMTPMGTLVLVVRTHHGPRPVLPAASWRSAGSWVAVPPTRVYSCRTGGSVYRWVTGAAPSDIRGELPHLAAVYEVIHAAVSGLGRGAERASRAEW